MGLFPCVRGTSTAGHDWDGGTQPAVACNHMQGIIFDYLVKIDIVNRFFIAVSCNSCMKAVYCTFYRIDVENCKLRLFYKINNK